MKINLKTRNLARAAIVASAALFASSSYGQGVNLSQSYNPGDVFIGFRQTGVSNTLVVNLGSATKFLPASLGGTWNGEPFKVTFGLVPNTTNAVTNLSSDLVANFGLDWSDNFTDGTSVRWGVVGFTDNSLDNVPINGFNLRTAFLTKARVDPLAPASPLGSVSTNGFATEFFGFSNGSGFGSYISGTSTVNSTLAYRGDGGDVNNWNSRIGPNGTFGLGSGRVVEQLNSGAFQGPTNSVLDFWVAPTSGSTLATTRTSTGGSFTLNSAGELTYSVVPEPGSAALLGLGVAFLGVTRRPNRSANTLN